VPLDFCRTGATLGRSSSATGGSFAQAETIEVSSKAAHRANADLITTPPTPFNATFYFAMRVELQKPRLFLEQRPKAIDSL
jgi:hypothetical protein